MTGDEILAVFDRRQHAWRCLEAAALAADQAESCQGKAFQVPVVFAYPLAAGRVAWIQTAYDFTGVLIQIGELRAKPP